MIVDGPFPCSLFANSLCLTVNILMHHKTKENNTALGRSNPSKSVVTGALLIIRVALKVQKFG